MPSGRSSSSKKRPAATVRKASPSAKKAPARKPAPKPAPKAKSKVAPPPAKAKSPTKPAAPAPPLRPADRSHLLSLSFLRDGDEFMARLETGGGQITELKNRSLDQLLSLVANELEDLLE